MAAARTILMQSSVRDLRRVRPETRARPEAALRAILTEPEKKASVVAVNLDKHVLRKIESIDWPPATGRNRVRRIGKGLVGRLEKTEVDVMDTGLYREDIRPKEYSVCMAK